MHVDAPRLTVMDLATHHRWIGVRLHLEAGYTVPMDVTALKVTLGMDGKIQNECMSYKKMLYRTATKRPNKNQHTVSHHAVVERKNSDVSAVVDVIPSDDRVAVVFHPDPSQSVV